VTSGALEERLAIQEPVWRRRLAKTAGLGAVVLVYVGSAKLGLELSVAHGLITPVWPPTGVALATLVLFGRGLWPLILLAAFIANVTSDASAPVAFTIAVGNTLEAVAGRELLHRARFRPSLERLRDVFALIALAAVASTAIGATNGVTTLAVAGDLPESYGSSWLLWWVGDAMGNLVVASLLLVLATAPLSRIVPRRRAPEAVALLVALVGVSSVVFLGGAWRYPHLLFPLYVWAALRFVQVGAVVSSFVVATIALAGAVSGNTPLGSDDATHVVQVLEGLLAGITISVLILAAVLSERRNAEEQLAEAQELSHVGSWSWDIGADRITWSAELYRVYGRDPTSRPMTFEQYRQLIHPDDRELARRNVVEALAERQPFAFEHRLLLPDGRVRWVQGRGRVVLDRWGAPVRLAGTSQDITERKQLDELRDTILSAVSHELRTPLTAIIGFAVTLQERTLDHQLRAKLLENVLEQGRRLERLLTDLLDLDRIRHGVVKSTFAPVDVQELVERVVDEQRETGRSIAVRAEPLIAEIDGPKVERIVGNLIANAVRYSPPTAPITVRVEPAPGGVVISVDDQGPGVAPTERSSIFEVFRRGVGAASLPGTGIGLSLVAQFAALHGGRAWVEESDLGGASFRVFLPERRRA
jgi:PAS domain S-box-containing protein